MLKTLSDCSIGVLHNVNNLHFNVNYAELSKVEFDVPFYADGKKNPLYSQLTGRKQIFTKDMGIYVLMNPQIVGTGDKEVKKCTGYSLEYTFSDKMFFLEEGTYNLWDPINTKDTILGRIIELDPTWSVGDIDSSLLSGGRRYRTFDEYKGRALDFCYNDAPEKFQCLFVFDPYEKKIHLIDAVKEVSAVPVYLDYHNLLESVDVKELSEEVITKLYPYGADGLSIREVNPTGKAYIVDLSHYMEAGDISPAVAERIRGWQIEIRNRKMEYTGIVSMRASATSQLILEEALLTDLQGELSALVGQQNVTVQAHAMESSESGKANQQSTLDSINADIAAKKSEISAEEQKILQIESSINEYTNRLSAITAALSMENYFTSEEMDEIRPFLIEDEVEENTFIASTVDSTMPGEMSKLNGLVSISSSIVKNLPLPTDGKNLYSIDGGIVSTPYLTANIIRGTLEVTNGTGEFVMSLYVASGNRSGDSFPSGLVTLSGHCSAVTTDAPSDAIGMSIGATVSFSASNANLFFTANVSEYQRYAVAENLYDYGVNILDERSWPGFEYSIDAANPLYIDELSPIAERLEFGRGVYVNIHQLMDDDMAEIATFSARAESDTTDSVRIATLIGLELGYDKPDNFSFIFSSRFRRHDEAATLLDTIESGYSSGRSFDAGKYIYNQAANKTSQITQFMNSALDAGKNTIIGASNQSVIIDGNGLQIGGDENYQIRMVDRMIAMTDDGWATAKLAIGRFALPGGGNYWGINADLLAGKLLIGNSLVLENPTDDGVMQFKVDETGAWLYNSVFSLAHDGGGKLLIHPKYGIAGGMSNLYTTDGTTVTPSFIDSGGELILDDDGLPENANLLFDIRDGSAYFRGKIYAEDGVFSGRLEAATGTFKGELSAATGTFSGELKAATGSFSGEISGGSININDRFKVDSTGHLTASSGTFSGTVSGATYLDSGGNNMMDAGRFKADYLSLKGLTVTDSSGNTSFSVGTNGNIVINGTVSGNINMGSGSTINWGNVSNENLDQNPAYTLANTANTAAGNASTAAQNANTAAQNASAAAQAAANAAGAANTNAIAASDLARAIANGTYSNGTFINGTTIYSPTIYSNAFNVIPVSTDNCSGSFNLYSYFGGRLQHFLQIRYLDTGAYPLVDFYSPGQAYAKWAFTNTEMYGTFNFGGTTGSAVVKFRGSVDFSGATVTGLAATTVSASNVTGLDTYIANYLAAHPPIAVFGS